MKKLILLLSIAGIMAVPALANAAEPFTGSEFTSGTWQNAAYSVVQCSADPDGDDDSPSFEQFTVDGSISTPSYQEWAIGTGPFPTQPEDTSTILPGHHFNDFAGQYCVEWANAGPVYYIYGDPKANTGTLDPAGQYVSGSLFYETQAPYTWQNGHQYDTPDPLTGMDTNPLDIHVGFVWVKNLPNGSTPAPCGSDRAALRVQLSSLTPNFYIGGTFAQGYMCFKRGIVRPYLGLRNAPWYQGGAGEILQRDPTLGAIKAMLSKQGTKSVLRMPKRFQAKGSR